MAEKKPPEINFIQVKPPEDEIDISQLTEGNDNAIKKIILNGEKAKFYPIDPTVNITGAFSFCDVDIRIPNRIEEMFLAKEIKARNKTEQQPEGRKAKKESKEVCKGKEKKKERTTYRRFKNKVEPIDSDTEQELNSKHRSDVSPRNQNAVRRKKKKKPKQNKKKEKKAKDEMPKVETAQIAEEITEEDVSKKQNKFPCVFGFIGQWLAKRREKRKEKERKALDAAFTSVSDLCCDEEYSRDVLNVDDVGIHVF